MASIPEYNIFRNKVESVPGEYYCKLNYRPEPLDRSDAHFNPYVCYLLSP